MSKKLYVGNLSDDSDNSTLESLLSPHGTVENVNIIADRRTGQSKGYGFVEMSTEAEAQAAITALDGTEYNGRSIKVAQATPPKSRPRRGGGDRSSGGGYGRSRY